MSEPRSLVVLRLCAVEVPIAGIVRIVRMLRWYAIGLLVVLLLLILLLLLLVIWGRRSWRRRVLWLLSP